MPATEALISPDEKCLSHRWPSSRILEVDWRPGYFGWNYKNMDYGVSPEPETIVERTRATDRVVTVQKSMQLLDTVADSGGSSAQELSEILGFSLPTVYRLAQELVANGYLTHLRSERRFELGYKVYDLGLSLYRQLGASEAVQVAIDGLRLELGLTACYAVYRGTDIVLTYISDHPNHQRLAQLRFGFHKAAHATAFGKILLAGMTAEQRNGYFRRHGMVRLTPATITDRNELEAALGTIARRGIAWEHDEFISGMSCAAAGVRDGNGTVVAAVAVSRPTDSAVPSDGKIEHVIRDHAQLVGKHLRSGTRLG